MSGQITCYLDCVSPYSYFALVYLEKHREVLKSHGVSIDIVPVFLGGINVGSGNKPPWTLPAKASYSTYDSARAKAYFGLPNIKTPSFFPILSLLPQRSLIYIKSQHPTLFIPTFISYFHCMWEQGIDLSVPELLATVLLKIYDEAQTKQIMEAANSPEVKKQLNDNTKEALDHGAFGCPWYWVRNKRGEEEPFFGSDRFHYMWEYLGLPWKDMELPMGEAKAKI
ncbi:glutathione S-transferase kappa 1 [Amniculicola lignicola CBS 123094]|uniref:Glutathione S-transferase kappa n=1 Tax=Amniculicola lignicola CBS 123094 TaxID=1392246 RepID=A0A6A5WEI7_9PLEO|nr:glutathione S-transferase kappa 1 [Amniculicola lignicola CBS 123094]